MKAYENRRMLEKNRKILLRQENKKNLLLLFKVKQVQIYQKSEKETVIKIMKKKTHLQTLILSNQIMKKKTHLQTLILSNQIMKKKIYLYYFHQSLPPIFIFQHLQLMKVIMMIILVKRMMIMIMNIV